MLAGSRMLWNRVPWVRIWTVGVWLAKQGRDRLHRNLEEGERQELISLMRQSKGRPGNLSHAEQQRFRALVRKAATGARH